MSGAATARQAVDSPACAHRASSGIPLKLAAAGLMIACQAVVLTMSAAASAAGAQEPSARQPAPLELKQPASARPWHRYKVDSQGSAWPQTEWRNFNNLANLNVSAPPHGAPGFHLPIQGDAERGRGRA